MAGNEQTTPRVRPLVKAAVIGLGLIGGSIAKALRTRAALTVVGLDIDPAVLEQARSEQVLADSGTIHPDDGPEHVADTGPWSLLQDCDIVFICTPASTIARLAHLAAAWCPGLITDVASVKRPVLEQVRLDRFIGGHPMAGSERQGYAHATPGLLENAVYVLCLPPDSNLPHARVRQLEDLIRKIGATPMHLDAAEHDRAVAAVSHLPHVVASALALLAARSDQGTLSRLAAGGFRDITRIASSDPRLWSGISLESSRCLLPQLTQYRAILDEYIQAIEAGDSHALHQLFYEAAHYRNSLPLDGRGALTAHSTLTVYVDDKPGVLGQVTTLLGTHGINISNIRIRELRAYEGGCLQLVLPDGRQAARAAWLLQEAGYVCD
ncbi:MAG: prephenate dehydrogenase [Clostridiaceae bacterium]|jgi:prephenate dehydrogenase|nr:prephenate dehydrogenase [Clostridiaceae bacterium]